MPELLTAATYLMVWVICWQVIGIESGLIKLIVSLGAAISVFVFLSTKDHQKKRKSGK
jgi:cell division protein FtsW (lipid II flippase)